MGTDAMSRTPEAAYEYPATSLATNKPRNPSTQRYRSTASATVWQALRNQLAPLQVPRSYEPSAHSVVTQAQAHASKFDLILFSERRIAGLQAEGLAAPTTEALHTLRRILNILVDDNGPAPQVGPTQSGSLEVQWLVDGIMIAAIFDSAGDYSLMVMDKAGDLVLDADIDAGATPTPEIQNFLQEQLNTMKERITKRPSDFYQL